MPDESLQILLVYGSVRRERVGIRLAHHLARAVEARGHRASLADPLEIDLPLLDRMFKEYAPGTAPEPMARMAGLIAAADAVVVISGEYNHGIPPALKNLLDHFLEEWFGRPAGIATYSPGRFGGVRAAMQLRMTLAELGMPTMPTLLPVPGIAQVLDEAGRSEAQWLTDQTGRFLDELTWWARAAKAERGREGA
ncbi:MAG: NADPH-dependent FMN reductase [Rhodospirillales bacterium]